MLCSMQAVAAVAAVGFVAVIAALVVSAVVACSVETFAASAASPSAWPVAEEIETGSPGIAADGIVVVGGSKKCAFAETAGIAGIAVDTHTIEDFAFGFGMATTELADHRFDKTADWA